MRRALTTGGVVVVLLLLGLWMFAAVAWSSCDSLSSEATTALESLAKSQIDVRDRSGHFAQSFAEARWAPPTNSRYIFGWISSSGSAIYAPSGSAQAKAQHVNGRALTYRDILREAPDAIVSGSGFRLAAVGDLDTDGTDPDFDVWVIDDHLSLIRRRDDCRQ